MAKKSLNPLTNLAQRVEAVSGASKRVKPAAKPAPLDEGRKAELLQEAQARLPQRGDVRLAWPDPGARKRR